ncbi:uncharacterized protein LOC106669085 [Cimex lectularius]|uniref:Uncharacterized protein n=1 Tax=Cimex lectularius TaxID=79782 RepID=A0A8I6RWW8_CIMLE|nr:uncharacterized protein LOC106669085 [Cimex lectularius]
MLSRSFFVVFGFLLLLHEIHTEETDKNHTYSPANFSIAEDFEKQLEFLNTTVANLALETLNCTFTIEDNGQLTTVVDKTREEIESEGKKILEENCTAEVELERRLSYGALASLTSV